MKKLLFSVLVGVFVAIPSIGSSSEQDPTMERLEKLWAQPFRIQLVVTATETLNSLVTSYISRELRAIKDVVSVDQDPDYVLSVIAIETETVSDYKTGVVLAVLVTKPWDNRHVIECLKKLEDNYSECERRFWECNKISGDRPKAEECYIREDCGRYTCNTNSDMEKPLTSLLVYVQNFWVQTGSTQDLRTICERIVAKFDSGHLEPDRKITQKFRDTFRKSRAETEKKMEEMEKKIEEMKQQQE